MTRSSKFKAMGWLAAAGLLGAALVAPATAFAVAGGNPPSVECEGHDFYLKIDNVGEGGVSAGDYTDGTANVETNWDGQTITISNVTDGGQSFAWASTEVVSHVVSKEGDSEFANDSGLPGTSGSVVGQIQQGLSHVTFCGDAAEPEVTPTPTPTAAATPTPTPAATPTATPEPEGSVEAETGTPEVTPPPTDSLSSGTPSSDGWQIVLLAMAAVLGTALVLAPAKRSRR
jgi:hypothetical protein